MKKRIGLLFALGLVALIGAGTAIVAQVISVPQVTTIAPTLDRVQIVPRGQPSAQSVYAAPSQINVAKRYVKATLTTGSTATGYTNTFSNDQALLTFDAGMTMSYTYITMAPNPSDGTEACFFSTGTVTTLYLSANTGQSLNDAAASLVANTRYCYLYSLSNLTWDRAQ